MGKIVVVGSSNTDMIVKVPHLPAPGETVLGGAFHTAAGGKGANQAVAAARAGGAVSFVACVGTDALGAKAVEGFESDGIDVSVVKRVDETPSGVALIFVDEAGENCIAVAPGSNAELTPADVEAREDVIAASDVVVVQMEIPLETIQAAVRVAAAHGTRVILNPAPAGPLPDELLRRVSVLTPNEAEAALLAGLPADADVEAIADRLLARGVETVVVTLGGRGAYVATRDRRERVAGVPVEVVDTTGAGDVFNGALAAALADGRPLLESVAFANHAAALSVTRLGAQPSAPGREAIRASLAADGPRHGARSASASGVPGAGR